MYLRAAPFGSYYNDRTTFARPVCPSRDPRDPRDPRALDRCCFAPPQLCLLCKRGPQAPELRHERLLNEFCFCTRVGDVVFLVTPTKEERVSPQCCLHPAAEWKE